jgi:hypothetical protein
MTPHVSPICACGRRAVLYLDEWTPRCAWHYEVSPGGSTLDWDREHHRWWKTAEAGSIAACLALTLIGGLLTFVVGIPGAANMFVGGLIATIVVSAILGLVRLIS